MSRISRLITIRRATPEDAGAVVKILRGIVAEGGLTAITEPWPVDAQRAYLAGLSLREAVHVAVDAAGRIRGYQTLDLWAPSIASMTHVGQVGTFLALAARGQGVGRALFEATLRFAREHGYGKFVIQVRAGNMGALTFYERLGFTRCGRLTRQVRAAGREEDELLLEYFLD